MFLLLIHIVHFLFYLAKAEISIIGEGIENIEEDDIALIFFITVKNICKDDLELSVNMVHCCETISSDETIDCNSIMLLGGDMGTLPSMNIKNLTLIYPNIYLFNRKGVCTISVTYRNQFKKREIRTDIHFDTSKHCQGKHSKYECETTDLDSKQNCNPVDCLIKYSGTTSYFNPECRRCQKVPICNSRIDGFFPEIAYSPYSNECIDLDKPISRKDLEDLAEGKTIKNETSVINAICHYGTVTESGKCLCNQGWTTATDDEGMIEPGVAQQHLCNIQVGDWNCINKHKIRITTILIAVFAVTIISKVLLLMCVMTWCYKHFRKTEKMCARELDPDDQNIILCEDLDSLEKCLCCDEEEAANVSETKRRLSTLQSQTVNVSYFPSSPSAFSSIKVSTGSSKSTTKSGPTIDFENTSSSAAISFPEGNSSEETENTRGFSDDEDNGSQDIAYGVYCGINEVEEEGEEEEIEEEEVDEEKIDEEEKT